MSDNISNSSLENFEFRWAQFDHTFVGGVPVVTASRDELAAAMVSDCKNARTPGSVARLVFDVNGHGLSLRATNSGYSKALDFADVIHADGGFVVSASRYLGNVPIAERSGTTDMIHDFARAATENELSFYLLGGTESVNKKCAEILTEVYPALRIAGRRNGYFDSGDEEKIISDINNARPDILWVGLGKPKEQEFSVRNRANIRAGWIVTCGGCFNYVTGDYARAPMWMQKTNLEWLHRMLMDPRRLFWRYFITNPHAISIVLLSKIGIVKKNGN